MHLQFFRIFFRNNTRNRLVSIINTLGLVFGLISTMLILEYVLYERSFENYNKNASRVYRVVYNRYQEGKILWKTANSFSATGYFLKNNFPEVEDFAIITMKYNVTVSYEDPSKDKVFYNEGKTYYSTASAFKLLGIPVLAGDFRSLEEPNTVAVSERVARKYFGNENPLGKSILVNFAENYTVKAIFKTIPENSHLKSDFFFSFRTIYPRETDMMNNWMGDYFHTFIMLRPGVDYRSFAAKAFPEMVQRTYEHDLNSRNMRDEYYLQPIHDIHLKSNIEYETEQPVNGHMVSILFAFSLFFLLVAWINYVNMITARAVERAREVGIKKVNGAQKILLVSQFIGEAFFLNAICLLIAVLVFFLINPYFAAFTGIQEISFADNPGLIGIAIAIFCAGIFLSGMYPAFVLSSYKPLEVLKGRFKNTQGGIIFRKTLVTFQFMVSLMLLIGTLAAFRQIQYLDRRDMGISYKSTMVIRAPQIGNMADEYGAKLQVLKNSIGQLSSVEQITMSSDIPGSEINHWAGGYRKGYSSEDAKEYFNIKVDDAFLDFYKIRMLTGRKFEKGELPVQHNIILNRSGAKRFGYENAEKALNEILIDWEGKELKIVGVTDDFYYYSKKIEPVPTILSLENIKNDFLSVKFNSDSRESIKASMEQISKIYESVFPDRPFETYFLDDEMKRDLKPDNIFITIFGFFSVIAILIAVIGILGLLLITINQSMKELAVRKALGAGFDHVVRLISRQLLWPFVLALVITIPFSGFVLKNWILINYIHHIRLSADIFLLPAGLILSVVASIVLILSAKVNNIEISHVLQYE